MRQKPPHTESQQKKIQRLAHIVMLNGGLVTRRQNDLKVLVVEEWVDQVGGVEVPMY